MQSATLIVYGFKQGYCNCLKIWELNLKFSVVSFVIILRITEDAIEIESVRVSRIIIIIRLFNVIRIVIVVWIVCLLYIIRVGSGCPGSLMSLYGLHAMLLIFIYVLHFNVNYICLLACPVETKTCINFYTLV